MVRTRVRKQTDYFTKVTLTKLPGAVDEHLLFGTPIRTTQYTRAGTRLQKEVHFFEPDTLFAIKSIKTDRHGYVAQTLYVLKSVSPGNLISAVPNVNPGARIITEAIGSTEVEYMSSWLADNNLKHNVDDFTPLQLVLCEFRMKGYLA